MVQPVRMVLALTFVAVLAAPAAATVPLTFNYQVMLTDDLDQPLSNQIVELVFNIYNADEGGAMLWSETHVVETNSIGVVSVILGKTNPLGIAFDQPLWLEVHVNGQPLAPRRELTSATSALHAHDSELLGGVAAPAYALDNDLYQPGVINTPANPLEWTKLKNVPSGFADGTDDAGVGDGYSLDASDGDPVDALFVNEDGEVLIGDGADSLGEASSLKARGKGGVNGAQFESNSYYVNVVAAYARCSESTAVLGNANTPFGGMSGPWDPAGVCGTARGNGNGGWFHAWGSGTGATCSSDSAGAALRAVAYGTGYSGSFEDGWGVSIEEDASYPALSVDNTRTTNYGDAGWFTSQSGVYANTWTIYASGYEGNAARFVKSTDDNKYCLHVEANDAAAEGIYVSGTIVSTSLMAQTVDTSRGKEAVFSVAAADVELIDSGKTRLTEGVARVEFDDTFAESISGSADLRVTATPVGGWSALYVASIDEGGFEIRSEGGDLDVEFHWVAVGRAKGREERPVVSIPDPEEEARIAAAKTAEYEASRPAEARSSGLWTQENGGPVVTHDR